MRHLRTRSAAGAHRGDRSARQVGRPARQGRALQLPRRIRSRRSSARRCSRWRAFRATTCTSRLVARAGERGLAHARRGRHGARHSRRSQGAAGAASRARGSRHVRAAVGGAGARQSRGSLVVPVSVQGARRTPAMLDDVSDVFVRHKELYRDLLEEAWRTADSRREVVIAVQVLGEVVALEPRAVRAASRSSSIERAGGVDEVNRCRVGARSVGDKRRPHIGRRALHCGEQCVDTGIAAAATRARSARAPAGMPRRARASCMARASRSARSERAGL